MACIYPRRGSVHLRESLAPPDREDGHLSTHGLIAPLVNQPHQTPLVFIQRQTAPVVNLVEGTSIRRQNIDPTTE